MTPPLDLDAAYDSHDWQRLYDEAIRLRDENDGLRALLRECDEPLDSFRSVLSPFGESAGAKKLRDLRDRIASALKEGE